MTELNRKDAVKIEGRQYVVIEADEWEVGTIITLIEDDHSGCPKFEDAKGVSNWYCMSDVMLLAETEEPEQQPEKVTEFEVGTVYVGTSGEIDLIQKQEDGSNYRVSQSSGKFFAPSILDEADDTWTVATAEQAAEFNKRKLQHQLDNLEEGEVYVITARVDDWIARVTRVEEDTVRTLGEMTPSDGYYCGCAGRLTPKAIRPATAEEIAELEAAEIKAGDREKPVEPELPKHKFAVGDKVEVTSDNTMWHSFKAGDIATVETQGFNVGNNQNKYTVSVAGMGYTQTLLESQLKAVEEPKQFIPEVGKIYFADQTGKHSWNWIVQVEDLQGKDVIHNGSIIRPEGNCYRVGRFISLDSVTKWTEATPEQAIKLLQAKVEHSDATEADLKQLSELMPLDNPELTVGEVYYSKQAFNWIFRHENLWDGEDSKTAGFHLTDYGSAHTGGYLNAVNYRKALPHEVAQLEAAEKEHGCEYVKPLINSNGTVIEVGKYYKSTRCDGLEMIYKVTSVDVDEGHFLRGEQQLQSSTGTLEPVLMGVDIDSIYGNTAVPASPAEIEKFKQAEARANLSIQKGKKYAVENDDFFPATITVTGITESNYQVKYKGLFGNNVQENISKDSDIWKTAVEVE